MKSHWSVSEEGIFCYKGRSFQQRPLNIIHVDDHQLFARGFARIIIPFFPLATIRNIKNGDEALSFITRSIESGDQIDFIVTDIMHPGLRGNDLVEEIRKLELKYHRNPIPVLVFSMYGPELLAKWMIPGQRSYFRYLGKASDPDIVVDTLEEMLY